MRRWRPSLGHSARYQERGGTSATPGHTVRGDDSSMMTHVRGLGASAGNGVS